MIARGCGIAINFMTALMILLMCRPLITKIRMSELGQYVPVDHHVSYHKVIGMILFIFSFVHSLVHICNISKNLSTNFDQFLEVNNLTMTDVPKDITFAEALFTDKLKLEGAIKGWANPTGVVLMIIAFIMLIGVHPKIRAKGHFEIFYWTHCLYVLFIFLMFLHCDQTVIWLTIPICLFLIYKLMMIKKWFGGSGKTYVVSGVLLPSKVTNLNIRRNKDFNFNPGDWVFINIPSISNFEWHPFTIS